jgi:dihydrofolate reductase
MRVVVVNHLTLDGVLQAPGRADEDTRHGFRHGGNLVIMGSGVLIRSLLPHGLVDELFLMVHPVVLGSGERLFGPADDRMPLALVDSATTSAGVLLTTYRAGRRTVSEWSGSTPQRG